MKLRILEPDSAPREVVLELDVVTLGRDPACDVAFDPALFPTVSGLHAELRKVDGHLHLIHRSRSNRTLLNDAPISREAALSAGDRIRLGFTGPTIIVLDSRPRNAAPPHQSPAIRSVGASDANATQLAAKHGESRRTSRSGRGRRQRTGTGSPASAAETFEIGAGGIIGRDPATASFVLDHTHVSRTHARLVVRGRQTLLTDLGSANGTYVNGEQVVAARELVPGDIIDIGPFSLRFDGALLTSQSRANNVQLFVKDIGRVVQDTAHRRQLTLLHGVTFVLNPGEFLAILGPSGSGKSTLLGVISGRGPASTGSVLLNGRDLHTNFAALREDVAVVPQHTLLHDSLTVEQSLLFTAALRLPSDSSRSECRARVDEVLQSVGLTERRTVRIRQLSGGQQKRAGLASELTSEPSLLFLDEVTSGLDEHADSEMMELFRSLADQGKTLACITHNLSHVPANCNLVAVLTAGGRLAFYGSPADALKYFSVEKLADIYLRLDEKPPDDWAAAFRKTTAFVANVQSRQPASEQTAATPFSAPPATERLGSFARQFAILVMRNILLWRNDLPALAVMLGQAVLVAFLLAMVFGSLDPEEIADPAERMLRIRTLLFLVGVSAFWLGCNNSVKEIVKERRIYEREREFNLIPESYLASKLLVMASIAVSQALFLGWSVYRWCDMPGSLTWHLVQLSGVTLTGTALGLAISAMSKTEEVAVAAVPLVVLPQIFLAGVVAPLSTGPELLSRLVSTVYWSQHAAEGALDSADRLPSDFDPGALLCASVLGLHASVFLCVAWYGTRWLRRSER